MRERRRDDSSYRLHASMGGGMTERQMRWLSSPPTIVLDGTLRTPHGICLGSWYEEPRPGDSAAPGSLHLQFVYAGRIHHRYIERVARPTERGMMQRLGRFVGDVVRADATGAGGRDG